MIYVLSAKTKWDTEENTLVADGEVIQNEYTNSDLGLTNAKRFFVEELTKYKADSKEIAEYLDIIQQNMKLNNDHFIEHLSFKTEEDKKNKNYENVVSAVVWVYQA